MPEEPKEICPGLLRHSAIPYCLTFSPSGDMLAVVGGPLVQPGELRLWDARPLIAQ